MRMGEVREGGCEKLVVRAELSLTPLPMHLKFYVLCVESLWS